MIRWKLAETMARYRVTSKALAKALKVSPTAIPNIKNADCLPELGSNKLCQISDALSELAETKMSPFDLMEHIEK